MPTKRCGSLEFSLWMLERRIFLLASRKWFRTSPIGAAEVGVCPRVDTESCSPLILLIPAKVMKLAPSIWSVYEWQNESPSVITSILLEPSHPRLENG